MCKDDGIFLGVFEDDFPPGVHPDPSLILTLHPEVHCLDLLCVNHYNIKLKGLFQE